MPVQAAAGDSVDLLKVVALPIAKRAAPVAAAAAVAVTIGFLLGRRNRPTPGLPKTLRPEDIQAALLRLLS